MSTRFKMFLADAWPGIALLALFAAMSLVCLVLAIVIAIGANGIHKITSLTFLAFAFLFVKLYGPEVYRSVVSLYRIYYPKRPEVLTFV